MKAEFLIEKLKPYGVGAQIITENVPVAEVGFCWSEKQSIEFDFSEHDKKVAEEKDRKIAELERDLNRLTNDLKEKASKIYGLREENKLLKSKKKHIYIVGKEIDGQNYVKFEDFMSIVEELQESLVDSK